MPDFAEASKSIYTLDSEISAVLIFGYMPVDLEADLTAISKG